MDKKIKVYNHNAFDIAVRFPEGREALITHGTFYRMAEDEIEHINNISTLFSKGFLVIEDNSPEAEEIVEGLNLNTKDDTTNFITDDEIIKKLKANANTLRKWLESVDDTVVLARVCEIGRTMDLPSSKVAVICEKIPAFVPQAE